MSQSLLSNQSINASASASATWTASRRATRGEPAPAARSVVFLVFGNRAGSAQVRVRHPRLVTADGPVYRNVGAATVTVANECTRIEVQHAADELQLVLTNTSLGAGTFDVEAVEG